MWWQIEYFFGSMYWVGDNDNFQYSYRIGSLICTISNGKEFSFCIIDIDCMMKCFDNRFVTNIDVGYGYSCYNLSFELK